MIDTNRSKTALQCILPVFALFLATSAAMWAQASGGSMVGTVHDPAGAVVPNAAVTITNTDTNTTYPVATNGDGRFLYPATAGRQLQSFGVCARLQRSRSGRHYGLDWDDQHPRHRPPGRPDVAIGHRDRKRATDPDGELRRRDHGPRGLGGATPTEFQRCDSQPPRVHDADPGLSRRFNGQRPIAG